MLKSEFDKLAGFETRPEEYAQIEAAYMADPCDDKAAWVEDWSEHVGMKGVLKARSQRIDCLEEELKRLRKMAFAVDEFVRGAAQVKGKLDLLLCDLQLEELRNYHNAVRNFEREAAA